MAEEQPWRGDLKLHIDPSDDNVRRQDAPSDPKSRRAPQSDGTIRPTPPIDIPREPSGHAVQEHDGDIEYFLRNRRPSISFNEEIVLESGHRQSMQEPLQKPGLHHLRGRSLMQALNEAAKTRAARAHSESERTNFDPVTGRHLPQYSHSPTREHARIGEGRFPLLQSTVDAMARESHTDLPNTMSVTSDSTTSPVEEAVETPRDSQEIALLSSSTFPFHRAASYEDVKPFRRTASQRWREGERPADVFTRASYRKESSDNAQSARRLTASSVKSPQSAASSFLRAFSTSSRDDETEDACAEDASGETVGDNYVIGKQIGFGGFSVIKEVTQMLPSGHQRKLAAKIVKRQLSGKSDAENEQAQAEFEHEVELWRRLSHPHILVLESVYVTDEATFCFIPLASGGTLFDLIRHHRQGLAIHLAQRYTYQLASALRYLHREARVVHRDVKLENVLFDRSAANPSSPTPPSAVPKESPDENEGNIRLCDFGMAESLAHSPTSSFDADSSSSDNDSRPSSPLPDRPPTKHIGPADTSTSAFAGGSLDYAAPEILRIARSLHAQQSNSNPNNHNHTHTTTTTTNSTSFSASFSLDPSSSPPQHHSGPPPDSTPNKLPISPAVDIWALGVCVYAMLLGSRPFSNAFQPRVVMSILAGEWDRDALRERAGVDALELVAGCLEMEVGRRWGVEEVLGSRWLGGIGEGRGGIRDGEGGRDGGW